MHTTPIQIRFNDVDQMGHVNNAVIMEYLDLGKDAFFSGHGLSPTKSDFTVMVVHYDVDFKAQIHYHDKIQVETSIERFGTKSLTVLQRVVNSERVWCVSSAAPSWPATVAPPIVPRSSPTR